MLKVKQHVFISLPVEEVFTYVSDFENMADWSSSVIAVRKISPGANHVGMTGRCTIRFLGRWLDSTFEVIEYEPGRYLTFKSISGITPFLFCYQFDPVQEGGTSVTVDASFQFTQGGVTEVTEQVVSNAIRRQLECDLHTLKDLLEAGVATQSMC